jgi:hypothetical protein
MRKTLITALAAVAALLTGAGVAAADDNTGADRNHDQTCEDVNGVSVLTCGDARDLLDLHNLLKLDDDDTDATG